VVHVLAFLARISPKPLQIEILMKTDDFFDQAKPADAPKHQTKAAQSKICGAQCPEEACFA
jgi:hypothetical protein